MSLWADAFIAAAVYGPLTSASTSVHGSRRGAGVSRPPLFEIEATLHRYCLPVEASSPCRRARRAATTARAALRTASGHPAAARTGTVALCLVVELTSAADTWRTSDQLRCTRGSAGSVGQYLLRGLVRSVRGPREEAVPSILPHSRSTWPIAAAELPVTPGPIGPTSPSMACCTAALGALSQRNRPGVGPVALGAVRSVPVSDLASLSGRTRSSASSRRPGVADSLRDFPLRGSAARTIAGRWWDSAALGRRPSQARLRAIHDVAR